MYEWPGAVYEGEVKCGLRHGVGKLHVSERCATYDGEWLEGKRHGKGTLRFNFLDGLTMEYEG